METIDLQNIWPSIGKCASINHISIDTREPFSGNTLFFALKGKKTLGENYVYEAAEKGAKGAVVTERFCIKKKLPDDFYLIKVKNPLLALQKLAKAYRELLDIEIVPILGTHGKTLAKDLIEKIFANRPEYFFSKGSLNSQIGVPLSVFSLEKHHKKAAIEVAFTKPGELKRLLWILNPKAAVITQVQPKEIGFLSDPKNFWQEVSCLKKNSWILLPEKIHFKQKGKIYFFKEPSIGHPHIHQKEDGFELKLPSGASFKKTFTSPFPFLFDHLLAGIKAAHLLGAEEGEISSAFLSYQPELKRKEIWKTQRGIQVISDEGFTNLASLRESLKLFTLFPNTKKKIGYFFLKKRSLEDIASFFDEVHFEEDLPFSDLKNRLRQGDLLFVSGNKRTPLDTLANHLDDAPYGSYVTINLAKLKENIDCYKRHLPKTTTIMAVLKAFGYGTDPVSSLCFLRLLGINYFALAQVEEGVYLRTMGIDSSLFIIHAGILEAKKAVHWDLESGVSSLDEIEAFEKAAKDEKKICSLHLHINTGFNRFGCKKEEALPLAKKIADSPYLNLKGVFTHFAAAENPNFDFFSDHQTAEYEEVICTLKKNGIFPPFCHAANSSAALRFSLPFCNLVRIGLGLWGFTASKHIKESYPLKPAISLHARIAYIHHCKKGESVGYSRAYQTRREEETIAVLSIGYFDGLKQGFNASSSVIIRGKKAPMIGKICMDYMMVDISDIPDAKIGDSALIFGEDCYGHKVPLEDLAALGSSHAHELISSLGPRLPRIFLYEEAP